MNDKPLIDSRNLPMWVVASFILALLALITAFAGVYRTNVVLFGTQAQVMQLSKRIDDSRAKAPSPTAQLGAPAAAPVATK